MELEHSGRRRQQHELRAAAREVGRAAARTGAPGGVLERQRCSTMSGGGTVTGGPQGGAAQHGIGGVERAALGKQGKKKGDSSQGESSDGATARIQRLGPRSGDGSTDRH